MRTLALLTILALCHCTCPDQGSNYLIITTESLHASAEKLKTYRKNNGYRVSIQLLSNIAQNPITADQLDDWLENYQEQNPGLEYVVLLGDVFTIPAKDIYLTKTDTWTKTDLHLAIQHEDTNSFFLREIKLGRIPINTNDQFDVYMQKIQTFEQKSSTAKHILFFGNKAEMRYAFNRDIDMVESRGFTTTTLVDPEENDVIKILNRADIKMAVYYGHGTWAWVKGLNIHRLQDWQNPNNPILFLAGNCGFGNFNNVEGKTLSSQLLVNKSGAVAGIGASDNGGFGYDYIFLAGILENLIPGNTIGHIFNAALQKEFNAIIDAGHAIGIGSYHEDFISRISLDGDPAIQLN